MIDNYHEKDAQPIPRTQNPTGHVKKLVYRVFVDVDEVDAATGELLNCICFPAVVCTDCEKKAVGFAEAATKQLRRLVIEFKKRPL